MSRLEYYNRPLVAFDPTNRQHRAYYHQFLITRAWGRCPVRFICPDEHGPEGLVGVIQRQLLEYYARKEFGDTPKVDFKNTRQKAVPLSVQLDMRLLDKKLLDEPCEVL